METLKQVVELKPFSKKDKLEIALKVGEQLALYKSLNGYGGFYSLLKEVGLKPKTAYRYLNLHYNRDTIKHCESLNRAYTLLANEAKKQKENIEIEYEAFKGTDLYSKLNKHFQK